MLVLLAACTGNIGGELRVDAAPDGSIAPDAAIAIDAGAAACPIPSREFVVAWNDFEATHLHA